MADDDDDALGREDVLRGVIVVGHELLLVDVVLDKDIAVISALLELWVRRQSS